MEGGSREGIKEGMKEGKEVSMDRGWVRGSESAMFDLI